MNRIPIFFTVDNGYVPYLSVALESMMENADKSKEYTVIILHERLKQENIEKIKHLEKEPFQFIFKDMQDGFDEITDRAENRLRCDYFTMTIYYRMFMANMFPEYDKAVYIDSDLVVLNDISKLYEIDLGNKILGGCVEYAGVKYEEYGNYLKNAVGISPTECIDSGVLLMNLKKMREENLQEHFLRLLSRYHFETVEPVRDYLNAMCKNRIAFLDKRWDIMPTDERDDVEDPYIVHYNLFSKPWCYDGIQYEQYFWEYAKKSEYYQEILDHKNNYSDEQKEADNASFEIMKKKVHEIPQTYTTFKKLYEDGEKIRLW